MGNPRCSTIALTPPAPFTYAIFCHADPELYECFSGCCRSTDRPAAIDDFTSSALCAKSR